MKRLLVMAGLLFATLGVFAQTPDWPTKLIKIVVPFPPGGSADPIARILAEKLTASLGQPVIVENRAGASGVIGTNYVAKSKPDGYTFVLVFDTHAENPALVPEMPYDTVNDFAPVTLIGRAPMVIATAADKPYKTLGDLFPTAKERPGAVNMGSAANGSLGHLSIAVIQDLVDVQVTHVPYRGAQALVTDTVGGHVDAGIGSVSSMAAQVRAGKLRGLAVTGSERSVTMPDVPTLAEEGVSGFESYAWWAMFAPAATPADIVERFHAEVVKVLSAPDVRKQLAEQLGLQISANKPGELQAFLLSEMERWSKVIRDNGIKVN